MAELQSFTNLEDVQQYNDDYEHRNTVKFVVQRMDKAFTVPLDYGEATFCYRFFKRILELMASVGLV